MALDFLKDYPASVQAVPNLRPQQLSVQNQALGNASNLLKNTSQYQFDFAPIEQKAREDFQTKTVPSLAERFVGQGSGTKSSAFQGALGGAGSELETNLAALGSEYGLRNQAQQQGHLSNLLGYGLQPSFENIYTPSQPGFAKSAAPGLLNAGTQLGVAAIQAGGMGNAIRNATGTLGGAAAGTAAAAGAPLLPIFGGLAGAALVAGGIYGIVKAVKRKRANKAAVKAADQQFRSFEQYKNQHPEEFTPDFPKRRAGETYSQWGDRVVQYTRNKQMAQGITDPSQLLEV
jgi:hypothetical protein